MSRVQEIFTSMAVPILGIFETMSSLVGGAENLATILTGIAITYGVIKAAQQATLAFKAADLAYQAVKLKLTSGIALFINIQEILFLGMPLPYEAGRLRRH